METNQLIGIGTIVVVIGMFLIFIGTLVGAGKGESKVAVGGFIGFIPFGFANDKKMLYLIIGLSLLLLTSFTIISFFLKR